MELSVIHIVNQFASAHMDSLETLIEAVLNQCKHLSYANLDHVGPMQIAMCPTMKNNVTVKMDSLEMLMLDALYNQLIHAFQTPAAPVLFVYSAKTTNLYVNAQLEWEETQPVLLDVMDLNAW